MMKQQLRNKKEILGIKNMIVKITSATEVLKEKEICKVKPKKNGKHEGKVNGNYFYNVYCIIPDIYERIYVTAVSYDNHMNTSESSSHRASSICLFRLYAHCLHPNQR